MSVLRSGLHLLPLPLLGLQTLAYAMLVGDRGPRRQSEGTDEPQSKRPDRHRDTECPALAAYNMGCLAQSMSVCGFDVGSGRACGCERSGDHCIKRLR